MTNSPVWPFLLVFILPIITALTGFAIIVMVLTLVFGAEVKGAKRWLYVGGLSLQASEFVKPGFAVLAAWMFTIRRLDDQVPGYAMATTLYVVIAGLLVLQPDVGMTIVISAIWGIQFFIAGLPIFLVVVVCLLFIG